MSRYIDADKLTSVIKPMCGEFTDNGFMIDYQRVLSIIDSAPTIEIDRPQGEWIYVAAPYAHGNPHYECNNCGESVKEKTNYCPNCGAKMKGVNNE